MLTRNADALLRLFTLTSIFALGASAQSRDDSFPLANVEVSRLLLTPLPDGGCLAEWCGTADSADGGVSLPVACITRELSAALNQNRCAALMNAGVGGVAKSLRFPGADAGAP